MASSATNDLQHIIECSVCMVKYETATRTPKILGCGHTFCMCCLQTLETDHQLTCPTCRTVCDVPQNGVKGLTTNHSVISMLETVCRGCEEKMTQENCLHCGIAMCGTCLEQHVGTLTTEMQIILNEMLPLVKGFDDGDELISVMDSMQSQLCSLKEDITSDIGNEIRNFEDEQEKEKKMFLERQKSLRETFLTEQALKEKRRLDEANSLLKLNDAMRRAYDRKLLAPKWKDQIEKLGEKLNNSNNLSMQELMKLVHDVGCVRDYVDGRHTSNDYESSMKNDSPVIDLVETRGQGNVIIPALITNSQIMQYYRGLNKPEYVYDMMHESDKDEGFFNVAVSPKYDNIFVVDFGNQCIVRITNTGQYVGKFGSTTSEINPRGVCTTYSGQVLVSYDNIIECYEHDETLLEEIGSGEQSYLLGAVDMPWGIFYSENDDLYIADCNNFRVQVITSNDEWDVLSVFNNPPRSLAMCPDGTLIVGTGGTYPDLWKIDPDGSKNKIALELQMTRDNDKGFNQICLDRDGNILIADRGSHSILVVDIHGNILCTIGEKGSLPGQFNEPNGIALTRDGKLVVAEFRNRRIQLF